MHRSTSWPRAAALTVGLAAAVSVAFSALSSPQPRYIPPDPAQFAPHLVEPLVPAPSPAIYTKLWWNAEIAARDLDMVEQMGFGWIKQDFPWREIESLEDGERDWFRTDRIVEDAEDRGLKLIVRLDRPPFWATGGEEGHLYENAPPLRYGEFGDYCFTVAARYRGRIAAYQVWNEPNLSREWGGQPPNPAAYVELLQTCYNALRAADPDVIVISAPLAPTGTGLPEAMPDEEFLRGMYAAGGARWFHMLGVNAPGFAAAPWISPEEAAQTPRYGGHRWNTFRHVEDIRRIMVEYGDADKQIAIMEMGWTSDPVNPDYAWFAVDEHTKGQYLAAAYEYAAANWYPWVGIMTTIFLPDPYWTPDMEQYWWSITEPSWPQARPRPAFFALQDMLSANLTGWNARYLADYPSQTLSPAQAESMEGKELLTVPCAPDCPDY